METCKVCGRSSPEISSVIGVCRECILERWEDVKPIVERVHEESRKRFGLPQRVPRDEKGVQCKGCGNECKIPEGKLGFCGLVKNENGKLVRIAGTPEKGLCEYYYDPHVTNCVASWICPAGTGKGYPKFSYTRGPEYGYYNLAVFYGACNFNCLFCQNWHFRENLSAFHPIISAEELAEKVHERVSCICFFGGDPGPQLAHAIEVSKLAYERAKEEGRILRVCLETNGNLAWPLLKRFAKISFESGGCIKFDLKFFHEELNMALTGVSNKVTYKNFEKLARLHSQREEVPFLHASTLLIPGYVTVEEVRKISKFISSLDARIPYSLLGFHPDFLLTDLPFTSKKLARECYEAAKRCGLENVRIGNVHILV